MRRFCLAILVPLLAWCAVTKLDPGHVTARRLNRAEYNASVRDLLGISFQPADDFPQDDSGYGFDNIGDVLSLSPLLMEHYFSAAEQVARVAVFGPKAAQATMAHYSGTRRRRSAIANPDDVTGLGQNSSFHTRHKFPFSGEYKLSAGIGGTYAKGGDPARIGFWIDGQLLATTETPAGDLDEKRAATEFPVTAGEHTVSVSFLGESSYAFFSRIGNLEIGGPFGGQAGPSLESQRLIYTCGHLDGHHGPECPRIILGNLARRAYRRPPTEAELARLSGLVAMAQREGGSFDEGLAAGIEAILVSPNFLFHIEPDAGRAEPHPLGQYELAARLASFLWSSVPDDQLLEAAAHHQLSDPAAFEAQVRRMLADERSSRMIENFTGQWLGIRALESVKPDPKRFPEFDDYLRYSMRRETELFFENLIRQDGSVLDLLDGKYTFLNQRLAELYGIPGVTGTEFRKVDLAGTPRGGVITDASVLTVSSYPNRTSPVLRGKWILSNILNQPPPPPPPDVPNLNEAVVGVSMSMRQQLEEHRANPVCAGCHAMMDPLGFGLENFNAVGEWRARDGKFPIDASGTLPGGHNFVGPQEMEAILRAKADRFTRCLTIKLLTYALGRGTESADGETIDGIVDSISAHQYRMSSLISGIVNSVPFQNQRAERVANVSQPEAP